MNLMKSHELRKRGKQGFPIKGAADLIAAKDCLRKGVSFVKRIPIILLFLVIIQGAVAIQANAAKQIAAEATQEKTLQKTDPFSIQDKLNGIKKRLKATIEAGEKKALDQMGITKDQLQDRITRLREMEAIYQGQLTAIKKQVSMKEEKADLEVRQKDQKLMDLLPPPPYSLSLYDKFLDQLAAADRGVEKGRADIKLTRKSIEDASSRFEMAQQKLRGIREKLDTKKSPELNWQFEQARIEMELAQAIFDLQKINRENATIELSLAGFKRTIAQEHLNWIKTHLFFDDDELRYYLGSVEERRTDLALRIGTLINEQQEVETAWKKARERAEAAQGTDELTAAKAGALLKAREAWRETYQEVLEQNQNMFQMLNQEQQVWQRRYALLKEDLKYEQLPKWEEEAEGNIKDISRLIHIQQNSRAGLQSEIAAIEKQLSGEKLDPTIRDHTENQLKALRKQADRSFEYLTVLQGGKEAQLRLLDEIAYKLGNIPLKGKIRIGGVWIGEIWEFELWVIGEHSVTVKKVVIALIIMTVGIIFARYGRRAVGKRLSRRKLLDQTAVAATEKILYFIILLLTALFALNVVNIPLTAFTFLGGAIAIGVGFGAQNLINNFISGFIIMAERPIKIADMIEVEGNFATVEDVGARCTRIRTAGNVHILVPNSHFLEKSITNWTLSDKKVRAKVTVGVAYGTPTREASRLMIKAAHDHERTLKDPEPFVLFTDFGNNSLVFEVYFWLSMGRLMERRMIESDIRFRIDDLFREAGIVIAFPQQDVHLDTSKPLDLRIMEPGGKTGGSLRIKDA